MKYPKKYLYEKWQNNVFVFKSELEKVYIWSDNIRSLLEWQYYSDPFFDEKSDIFWCFTSPFPLKK